MPRRRRDPVDGPLAARGAVGELLRLPDLHGDAALAPVRFVDRGAGAAAQALTRCHLGKVDDLRRLRQALLQGRLGERIASDGHPSQSWVPQQLGRKGLQAVRGDAKHLQAGDAGDGREGLAREAVVAQHELAHMLQALDVGQLADRVAGGDQPHQVGRQARAVQRSDLVVLQPYHAGLGACRQHRRYLCKEHTRGENHLQVGQLGDGVWKAG
mmetsp:Transcript_53880/g.151425  ORF Transcript_53880/g.151425 Transcript_53880/m.151425 type:complete len:213 (+) Transcript_53880:620-1258(+)